MTTKLDSQPNLRATKYGNLTDVPKQIIEAFALTIDNSPRLGV